MIFYTEKDIIRNYTEEEQLEAVKENGLVIETVDPLGGDDVIE